MLEVHSIETVPTLPLLAPLATDPVTDVKKLALGLQVGARQDPGIRRKNRPNEDTLSITQGIIPACTPATSAKTFALMMVADGMGGCAHGKVASLLATHSLTRYISEALRVQPKTSRDVFLLLESAVQNANQLVLEHNQRLHSNMGTTMTVVLVLDGIAYVAHVGDSRLYLFSESDGLTQITRDHSVVAELVANKIIEPDDIYTHPGRNQIYRSLGKDSFLEVDVRAVPLVAGDLLLLCTDGLWEMVRDEQIASILTTPLLDPTDSADALLTAALAHGGHDNISIIVARVHESTQTVTFS